MSEPKTPGPPVRNIADVHARLAELSASRSVLAHYEETRNLVQHLKRFIMDGTYHTIKSPMCKKEISTREIAEKHNLITTDKICTSPEVQSTQQPAKSHKKLPIHAVKHANDSRSASWGQGFMIMSRGHLGEPSYEKQQDADRPDYKIVHLRHNPSRPASASRICSSNSRCIWSPAGSASGHVGNEIRNRRFQSSKFTQSNGNVIAWTEGPINNPHGMRTAARRARAVDRSSKVIDPFVFFNC
jgi:hypothetical protein